MYVTPGIIDMHVHVYYGTKMDQYLMNGPSSVQADAFSFRAGVTTMVDVGSSGWRSFPDFKSRPLIIPRPGFLHFSILLEKE